MWQQQGKLHICNACSYLFKSFNVLLDFGIYVRAGAAMQGKTSIRVVKEQVSVEAAVGTTLSVYGSIFNACRFYFNLIAQ